jgi:hypothetical protein
MGTDIYGWVEYWHPDLECWIGVIKLAPLVSDRNYELFAWLFGVRRRPDIPMRWQDRPLAAGRGLPADASSEVASEYASDTARFPTEYYGTTWASWREVQEIDWDEPIEDRIVASRRDALGQKQSSGTLWWRSQFVAAHADLVPASAEGLAPVDSWSVEDTDYQVVAMRRRDVVDHRWELLFHLMEALSSRLQSADHLRLVVWFAD